MNANARPSLLGRFVLVRENRAIPFLALLFALFLALALLVHSPRLLYLDRQVTGAFQIARAGALLQSALGLTFLGNTLTLVVLGGAAAAAFLLTRRPWAALLTGVSLLGVPINLGIKEIVQRQRPDAALVDVLFPATGLSFPSGHAMGSVMLYGFLALMAWVHLPRRRQRIGFTAGFALLALGVSLSRVYLGVHWFSDVVGGWAAGLFFLLILAEVYKMSGEGTAPA